MTKAPDWFGHKGAVAELAALDDAAVDRAVAVLNLLDHKLRLVIETGRPEILRLVDGDEVLANAAISTAVEHLFIAMLIEHTTEATDVEMIGALRSRLRKARKAATD